MSPTQNTNESAAPTKSELGQKGALFCSEHRLASRPPAAKMTDGFNQLGQTAMAANGADELASEIETAAADAFSGGRTNNITDILLSMTTIAASLVATVLAGQEVAKWMIATAAAVPAACTSLQQIVQFRERSHWYFEYAARARAIAMQLKYTPDAATAEFARKMADLDTEMERSWKTIGRLQGKAPTRGK